MIVLTKEGAMRRLLLASFVSVFALGACETTVEGGFYWDGVLVEDCGPYSYCLYSDGNYWCTDLDNDPYNCGACGATCNTGDYCVFGQCRTGYSCASVGLSDCGTYCADLEDDPFNCGACDAWCAHGEFCAEGQCWADYSCEAHGLAECGYGCVDLNTDPYNCGSCGTECVLGCESGQCL